MSLTVSLTPGRVSEEGDCAYGCVATIVSAQCPVHGFPVTKVRVIDTRTMRPVTGEVTLLAGIRLMRFMRTGQDVLPPDERVDPEFLDLYDVDHGKRVFWSA